MARHAAGMDEEEQHGDEFTFFSEQHFDAPPFDHRQPPSLNRANHTHEHSTSHEQSLAFNRTQDARLAEMASMSTANGTPSPHMLGETFSGSSNTFTTIVDRTAMPQVIATADAQFGPFYGPPPQFASLADARAYVKKHELKPWFPTDRSLPDRKHDQFYVDKAFRAATDITQCHRPPFTEGRSTKHLFWNGLISPARLMYKIWVLNEKTRLLYTDGCPVFKSGDRAYDEKKQKMKEGYDMSFEKRWDAICHELLVDKDVVVDLVSDRHNDYYKLILYPSEASSAKKVYRKNNHERKDRKATNAIVPSTPQTLISEGYNTEYTDDQGANRSFGMQDSRNKKRKTQDDPIESAHGIGTRTTTKQSLPRTAGVGGLRSSSVANGAGLRPAIGSRLPNHTNHPYTKATKPGHGPESQTDNAIPHDIFDIPYAGLREQHPTSQNQAAYRYHGPQQPTPSNAYPEIPDPAATPTPYPTLAETPTTDTLTLSSSQVYEDAGLLYSRFNGAIVAYFDGYRWVRWDGL